MKQTSGRAGSKFLGVTSNGTRDDEQGGKDADNVGIEQQAMKTDRDFTGLTDGETALSFCARVPSIVLRCSA